jgi:hypothetical protein
MAQCEHIHKCSFFSNSTVLKMTNLVQDLQKSYCCGDFTRCARYSVAHAVGKNAVPELMMPNQHDWARQIIEDTKKAQ